MLLADDLGWKDIGCYDGPVKTPTLDSLAANGVRFTDFYSGAAVCSPSRATTLTGRQHLRCGVYSWIADWEQNSQLLDREVTLAEVLQSNGYETVHLGKWHLGMPTSQKPRKLTPAEHGFDYWFGMANGAHPSHKNPTNFLRNGKPVGRIEGYSCQIVVDEAISWLDEEHNPDQPFFLNVWFHEPHAPIAAPDDIVSGYGNPKDPKAIYSGTIDNTDQAIARLLAKLHEVDAPEDTLIIYSSDNGSYRADRVGHLRGTKGSNYEGGIRVPGIFHWPGHITSGLVEEEPAGLVDVLPTVCGLLEIDKPKGVFLDGSDLTSLLLGREEKFTRHQPLFWHLPASGPSVALRDGKYSLVAHRGYEFPKDKEAMAALKKQIEAILRKAGTYDDEIAGGNFDKQMFEGFKNKEADRIRGQFIKLNMFNESWIPAIKAGVHRRFELFDLAADPSQTKDISGQHPEVFERLKRQMLTINESVIADAPDWHLSDPKGDARPENRNPRSAETMKIEQATKVHRLSSTKRSTFDAFVYVNRIPVAPEADETQEDLAGRVLGRLANQEGRVQLKLPPGMNRQGYQGFRIALEGGNESHAGRCFACHHLPDLQNSKSKRPIPSLRNRRITKPQLQAVLANETHRGIKLDTTDINRLYALIQTFTDVPDSEFRNLILNTTVLDTSGDPE
ncbi:MAG: sulfatase-like hydrolase/transferase [Fuerstiella sp.]|nr:sulfatase-like hydrolase/transferase [Fuerstiella sp.]MCP4853171.1 sulfatase-like hydrolase/transferase [Fuerstiella sp.]